MTITHEEQDQRCDTCKHEKEPWTNGCSDCFDYELWEKKEKEDNDSWLRLDKVQQTTGGTK